MPVKLETLIIYPHKLRYAKLAIAVGSGAVESGANIVTESIIQGTTMTGAKITEFTIDESRRR